MFSLCVTWVEINDPQLVEINDPLNADNLLKSTGMCLLKIQEPLQKQIIIKLICYKGKTKIGFYPTNLDPTCKYHCETFFTKHIESMIFPPGHFVLGGLTTS